MRRRDSIKRRLRTSGVRSKEKGGHSNLAKEVENDARAPEGRRDRKQQRGEKRDKPSHFTHVHTEGEELAWKKESLTRQQRLREPSHASRKMGHTEAGKGSNILQGKTEEKTCKKKNRKPKQKERGNTV